MTSAQEQLLAAMKENLLDYGTGPLFGEMQHRTLADKGMAGPTAAHVIEEVDTPENFAYTTYTTGTTAFQNIVGITYPELARRIAAGKRALELAGVAAGSRLLITYPPLVSVFSAQPMDTYGVEVSFPLRPSRDAFLYSLCSFRPHAVLGESAFLRASLQDAWKMGLGDLIPENLILMAAGTPLDLELVEEAKKLPGAAVHDLYGCQEFGWLAVDGVAVRDDVELAEFGDELAHLVVGGLPTGDIFRTGVPHLLNPDGNIVSYSRERTNLFWETHVLETTATDESTVRRCATGILRIKAKVVKLSPGLVCGAPQNRLELVAEGIRIKLDSHKTAMFDDLLEAQKAYQGKRKVNAVWTKEEYRG